MKPRILIVDDEEVIQDVLTRLLSKEGFEISIAENLKKAKIEAGKEEFDLIILDLRLPDGNGLEILDFLLENQPNTPVIILTAYATVESAIEAMKKGAFDYLQKPFRNQELKEVVWKAMRLRYALKENVILKRKLESLTRFGELVGKSKPMKKVYELIKRVAPTTSTVLIEGESGTGKELVAREIHRLSAVKEGPFVVFHCSNIPSELVESHLFGHKKGSFTGAIEDKKGVIEEAHGGTLFLDDITTLPIETQAKLLRFIENKEFVKIGETRPRKVEVRIIAATNEPLEKAVEERRFREDLFYRINVVRIKLPPLRQRKDDIPLLVGTFIEKYAKANGKKIKGIKEEALRLLLNYDWPGNVRELENAIWQAVIFTDDEWIKPGDLPEAIKGKDLQEEGFRLPLGQASYEEIVEEFERYIIKEALKKAGGIQKKAAELLKMNPSTLSMKIKRLGISSKEIS